LLWLPVLLVFFVIALAVGVLGALIHRLTRDPVRQRLASIEHGDEQGSRGWLDGLAAQLPQPSAHEGELDRELRRAGYYRPGARTDYLAVRNGLMLVVLALGGVAAVLAGPEREALALRFAVAGILGAGVCWALPRVILRSRGKRRVQKVHRALPDALDMISMCLTAGLSLRDSLAHLSREMFYAHPEMAVELTIVVKHAEMASIDVAFRQFAERVDAPEIVTMAALVEQSQRLGTDVAGTIYDYADTMRLQRKQFNDERSSVAGVKLLIPITTCLVPSVMIILWGPSIIELVKFFNNTEDRSAIIREAQ